MRRVVKIVAWNVDGVTPLLPRFPELLHELGDPDVLCLEEVRIRATDEDAFARLHAALPGYRCGLSLNADRRNVRFRGGRAYGVATWARASLRARHRTFPWDREGRVVVTDLPWCTIFNVYAVNGTNRPWLDEGTGETLGSRHDFKRAFQRILAVEMTKARGPIVAIGDWNVSQSAIDTHPRLRTEEPHARARAELRAIVDELALVDAFRALHGDERAYTWFARGARGLDAARVDFALVSESLVPRVVAADVLPRRPESDHAPIAVAIRPD